VRTGLFVHLTWTTWGRLPLVKPSVADFLTRFLPAECVRQAVKPIALGIVENHVHMILQLPLKFDVPRLVQGLKGASARLANRDGIAARESLRWEQGYDIRSVSPRHLADAIDYVRNQRQKHANESERLFGRTRRPSRRPEEVI
jgi:putative transposase